MKGPGLFRGLLLAAGILGSLAAGTPEAVFTTAALAKDGRIFVSTITRRPGWEPSAGLFAIHPDTLKRRRMPVPADLSGRELWALVPLGSGRLLVVSQQTPEDGDALQIHQVDPGTGLWLRLATLPACVSVTEIRLERERLVFRCEAGGAAPLQEEAVPLPEEAPALGRLAPEAAEAQAGATRIRFTGLPFAWEELEVVRHRTVRRFRP